MSITINYYFVLADNWGSTFDGVVTCNNILYSTQHIDQLKQKIIDVSGWENVKPCDTYFINLIELSRVEV